MSTSAQRIQALDRVLELAVLVNADMTKGLAERGLTDARAHLLWVLRGQGPCTQRVIAEALRVSPRNVTGLVDGLVATGFVTREPHPTDRRAILVRLTEHGTEVAETLEEDQREFARLLFGAMSDERTAGLIDSLDEVLVRLRELVAADEGVSTRA